MKNEIFEDSYKVSKAILSFEYFVNEIFSLSFDNFVGGVFVNELANYYQKNENTFRVSARDHMKSSMFYAHFMWNLLRFADVGLEAHYFSFQEGMAAYHISKIKELIRRNPFYKDIIDHKPTADSVIDYSWSVSSKEEVRHLTLEPHGFTSFKRGIHCGVLYIDDPLRDPENKLNPLVIEKVNRVFFTEIIDMAPEIHGAGTPQTWVDFFFDKRLKKRFNVVVQPAIKSYSRKEVLWPEWKSFEELMDMREVKTPKIFDQEYQCKPVYSENSYLTEGDVLKCLNSELSNLFDLKNENQNLSDEDKHRISEELKDYNISGGLDIGKKAHPSHVAVWKIKGNHKQQIFQKFLDHWDYDKQLKFCKKLIEIFGIDYFPYDNTRGEFEGFAEQGQVPSQMIPIVQTAKKNNALASSLQKDINSATVKLELIDDLRQTNQILAVDNDLQAMVTPEGHGDSFWSNAMALWKQLTTRAYLSKPKGF